MHPSFPLIPRFVPVIVLAALPLARGAPASEAAPVVAVARVTRQDLAKELTVQAEFRPYQEVDLHAKVAGYLQQVNFDIGDTVKAGDAIATLEVPELREDLARGEAAVQRAEANYKDAHLNFTRLRSVSRGQPNLVAQQDLDAAEAKDAAVAAALAEAKADREKLRAMDGYTRITAPFAGVITKRYADPGALIQAGISSSTQAMPIVRLSQNNRLRLDFPISISYASAVKVGDQVDIDFGEQRQRMTATVARFSRRIAMETRTMIGEIDVENADLALLPGMYVTVVLKVDRRPGALGIPVEAVSGTKQPTAYVVNAKGAIEERPLQLGIETPTRYEVLSGLHEGDLVMIGNRAQVRLGQQVTTKMVDLVATQ